jgi:hypothetical protein
MIKIVPDAYDGFCDEIIGGMTSNLPNDQRCPAADPKYTKFNFVQFVRHEPSLILRISEGQVNEYPSAMVNAQKYKGH